MPWDGSPRAGFTSGKPWLPLGSDHASVNVAALNTSAGSILNLYRELIELRRNSSALVHGAIDAVEAEGNILKYERCQGNKRLAIALNFSHDSAQVSHSPGQLLVSTHLDRIGEEVAQSVSLRPNEGIIVQVRPESTSINA